MKINKIATLDIISHKKIIINSYSTSGWNGVMSLRKAEGDVAAESIGIITISVTGGRLEVEGWNTDCWETGSDDCSVSAKVTGIWYKEEMLTLKVIKYTVK